MRYAKEIAQIASFALATTSLSGCDTAGVDFSAQNPKLPQLKTVNDFAKRYDFKLPPDFPTNMFEVLKTFDQTEFLRVEPDTITVASKDTPILLLPDSNQLHTESSKNESILKKGSMKPIFAMLYMEDKKTVQRWAITKDPETDEPQFIADTITNLENGTSEVYSKAVSTKKQ